jgi:hypothetical protein
MPTLASTDDRLIPRSTLRHRPIASQPDVTPEELPRVPRASRPSQTQQQIPPRKTTKTSLPVPPKQLPARSWQQKHWPVFLGVGMLVSLAIVCIAQLVGGWISTTSDDLRYGRPRTFQTDAFVGHEPGKVPSHFIALNLRGRVEVIEFPGGDATHAKIYMGPQLYDARADLIPVTLHFVDTRHDHHPDMFVQFHTTQILFYNEQGTFRPG